MIIHGPILSASEIYDVDLGPIMLNDWYHQDYYTLVNGTMHGAVPASNNNLVSTSVEATRSNILQINGKMNYPCGSTTLACTPNAGISKFQFQSGKKYRLRLINTSAEGIQKFSIDSHNFTVIANDFVPVKPYTTNMITLGVAQRTDVIVSDFLGESFTYERLSLLASPCQRNG
jgi:FtsP/CotA-like multicopper oxidase with cupredoxin domain